MHESLHESRDDDLAIPRRELFRVLGWGSLGCAAGLAAHGVFQFSLPLPLDGGKSRILLESAERYIHRPMSFIQRAKLFVRYDEGGLAAMSAVCTHLACVVRWNAARRLIECPCHGSTFNAEGKRLSGPARANLSRYHVDVSPDGRLVVDLNRKVPLDRRLKVKRA